MSERFTLHLGDCLDVLPTLEAESVDAVVTDAPYHLQSIVKRFGAKGAKAVPGEAGMFSRSQRGFLGATWDGGDVAFRPETWAAVLRVAKPGAYLAAMGGARTCHNMAVAIEEGGWEIANGIRHLTSIADMIAQLEDSIGPEQRVLFRRILDHIMATQLAWVYSQGAPKGNKKLPDGRGTILAPAFEPIILARKPLREATYLEQVRATGTGGINIEACRGPADDTERNVGRIGEESAGQTFRGVTGIGLKPGPRGGDPEGRWPKTILHDGSDEVVGAFPFNEGGSASRFFYSTKAKTKDREEGLEEHPERTLRRVNSGGLEKDPKYATVSRRNHHPTPKPTDLMQWLARLCCPRGGVILDPFLGSGSTGKAAMLEGFRFVGIEMGAEYLEIARGRIEEAARDWIAKSQRKAKREGYATLFDLPATGK